MPPVEIPKNPEVLCVTDVGSTTTKAILFVREDGWKYYRREAPTTVAKPEADVTIGVTQALAALESDTGRPLLTEGSPAIPYLATSSAGGGLAMIVTGLVREITTRSAERVALGAGAILLDVIAMDDGRTPYEKIEVLKTLRPDMILLAGGFDGDALSGPVFLAELIAQAGLCPKLNPDAQLPVLFAGNKNARPFAQETLGARYLFHPIDNLRPHANRENLEPARAAIHDLFMEHVMSQAPGYERLISWVSAPILPTPGAFGKILALASRELGVRILAVDIGGATTDVFTAERGDVFRTVSANLGMSYSIFNVVRTVGIEALVALLEATIPAREVWDYIGNKYIRPTGLPEESIEIEIERATAVAAIHGAVQAHLNLLAGKQLSRAQDELRIGRSFTTASRDASTSSEQRRVSGYDLVIGSGGMLSHSPPAASAWMLTQALALDDSVSLALDRSFMFPHLGVIAEVAPELALELLQTLGMIELGTVRELRRAGKISRRAPAAQPAERCAETTDIGRIHEGLLSLRRELAIPGEVFVSCGQQLEPDTCVARSTRRFLRPFFLPVGSAIGVAGRELPEYLARELGERVSQGEPVARRKVNIFSTKEFYAPVDMVLERILPDGTIVARELPETALQLTVVRVAQDLGEAPERMKAFLRVEEGQEVERGQLLAGYVRPGNVRKSVSPVRGRVKQIDHARGLVTIEPLLEELEVLAWLPGEVIEISDRGCLLQRRGIEIQGAWGVGGEVSGRLTTAAPGPGRVLLRREVDAAELARCEEAAVAGVIAGGLHLEDVLAETYSFTLVITEGFGAARAMRPELWGLLAACDDDLVLLDGTTELRVGVQRPRIIVPT